MKKIKISVIFLLMLVFGTSAFSQSRKNQWEIFFGAAIPTAPDYIKDEFKTGFSLHGQYVMFVSPQLGISLGLAGEGFTVSDELKDAGIDGQLTVGEVSIGLRPYLTSLEASTQIFLFGMATYNSVKVKFEDDFGNEDEGKEEKGGIAFGGGLEIPAGERFNLIFQGLGRVIFTEGDKFSFVTITAGFAF